MNGPFVVAQAGSSSSSSTASPVQIIKIVKPPAGQTEIFHASFTGLVKIDFTAIANERITFFKDNTNQSLHVIFADGSQAIIEPFFDSMGVLSNLLLTVGPDQDLTGAQFAAQFPFSTDQAVLPAGGPGGTPSGGDFHDPSVDPLAPIPLNTLLPPEELPPIVFHETVPGLLPGQENLIPTVAGAVDVVVEEEELSGPKIQTDAGWGNEDVNSLLGNDQDPVPGTHLDVSGTLAGLVSGGDLPITFLVNSAAAGTVVKDAGGNDVKSIGETVHYKFIDANDIQGVTNGEEGERIIFFLHVNSDGTFTFTLNDQIDHPDHHHSDGTNPQGIFEETLNLDLSPAVIAHDATPDPITFASGTLEVGVIDDTPILVDAPSVESAALLAGLPVDGNTTFGSHAIDDENQPNGIPGGPGDNGYGTCVSGTFGVRYGADGLSHFQVTEGDGGLSTIGTNPLVVDASKIIVTNDNGDQVPLDQFKAIYIEADGTGTQHVINHFDWAPNPSQYGGGTLTGTADDGHGGTFTVFTLDVHIDGVASDGTYVYGYDFHALAPLAHPFTNDGETEGQTAWEDNLHLDFTYTATDYDGDSVDGHLIFNVDDDVPTLVASTECVDTTIDYTSGVKAGNVDERGIDGPGDHDVLLSAAAGSTAEDVNTTGNDIGVHNQWIDGQDKQGNPAELLRIDFVNSLTFTGSGPSSDFNYNGHNLADSASFTIAQIQGGSGNTATVFVQVFDANDNKDYTDDGNPLAISHTDITAPAGATLTDVYQGGVIVGVVIEGLHEGDQVTVNTASDFDRLVISNYDGVTVETSAGPEPTTETFKDGHPFSIDGIESTVCLPPTISVSIDENVQTANPNPEDNVDPGTAPTELATAIAGLTIIAVAESQGLVAKDLFDANFGADGAAVGGGLSFQLTTSAGHAFAGENSGLTTTVGNNEIDLYTDPSNPNLVWGVANGDLSEGDKVFALYMDGDGHLWVAQFEAIANADAGSTAAAYDDIASITQGLIYVTGVITDGDGDQATAVSPASIAVDFQDSGPSADITLNGSATLVVDETAGAQGGETAPLTSIGQSLGQSTILASTLFTESAVFGTDGPAPLNPTVFSLNLLIPDGGNSNLTDTLSGDTVTLHVISGTEIQGQDNVGDVVFDLSIDSLSGDVTLTQYRAVVHGDPTNPDGSEPAFLADNLVGVTVTVTDGDGDTSSATANLNGVVEFLDDGPTAPDVALGSGTVGVDETPGVDVAAAHDAVPAETDVHGSDAIIFDGSPTTVANLFTGVANAGIDPDVPGGSLDNGALSFASSGAGSLVSVTGGSFGTDGAAASGATSYAFTLLDADSGLAVTDGSPITLSIDGDGRVIGTVVGGGFDGKTAFAIAIDPQTGEVYVADYLSLQQDSATDTPNDFVTLASGTVGVSVTLTDGDGDQVTADAVDISSHISFFDDGPTAHDSVPGFFSGTFIAQAPLDDEDQTGGIQNGPGDNGSGTVASGTLDFSGGADGVQSVAFGESINVTATDGVNPPQSVSQLQAIYVDPITGIGTKEDVTLHWVADGSGGGTLTGTSAHFDGVGPNDPVFTLVVDSAGNYTFTEFASLAHPITQDPASPGSTEFEDNLNLQFTYTVTDGDGDQASAHLTINVDDDVPTVVDARETQENPLIASVVLDESVGNDASNPGDSTQSNPPGDDTGNPAPTFPLPTAHVDSPIAFGEATIDASSISGLFSAQAGADGESSHEYTLTLKQADGSGISIGTTYVKTNLSITDFTATGNPAHVYGDDTVYLEQISAYQVNGIVAGVDGILGTADDQFAFRIAIDPATGKVTVDQYLAIHNDTAGDTPSAYDDIKQMLVVDGHNDPSSLGGIFASYSLTDGDGDKASATSAHPLQVGFQDDGINVNVAQATTGEDQHLVTLAPLTLDESIGGDPAGAGTSDGNGALDDNGSVTTPSYLLAADSTKAIGIVDTPTHASGSGTSVADLFAVTKTIGTDGLLGEQKSYSLTLTDANGDVVANSTTGVLTNLHVTDVGGSPVDGFSEANRAIWLYQVSSTEIIGVLGHDTVSTSDDYVALRITLTGAADDPVMQVEQYLPLEHPVGGTLSFDESVYLNFAIVGENSGASLGITLADTVTDGDGDTSTDSQTVTIAAAANSETSSGTSLISFQDDGPTINDGSASVTHDESSGLQGQDINPSALPSITTMFDGNPDFSTLGSPFGAAKSDAGQVAFSFGTDGAGSVSLTDASGAGFNGESSGLFTTVGHDEIFLFTDTTTPTLVWGLTTNTLVGATADNVAFAFLLDPSNGTLYVAQWQAIYHDGNNAPAFDGDGNDPNAVVTLAADLVHLTVTDGDGDTTTSSASITIGFADDGPTAPTVTASGSVIHDETPGIQTAADGNPNPSNDVDGTTIAFGTTTVADLFTSVPSPGDDPDVAGSGPIGYAASTSALVTLSGGSFGTDGAAATNSVVYSLTVTDGTFSGVSTTGGTQIFLYNGPDGLILGRVGTEAGATDTADSSGTVAFALAVDPASGNVYIAQYLSLFNPTAGSTAAAYDDQISLSTAAGTVQMQVTYTDGDGDSATNSAYIGSHISFQDDGPHAVNDGQTLLESHTVNTDWLSGSVSVPHDNTYTGLSDSGYVSITTVLGAQAGDSIVVSLSGGNGSNNAHWELVDPADHTTVLQSGDANGSASSFTISVAADGNYELKIDYERNSGTLSVTDVHLLHTVTEGISGDVTTNDTFGADGAHVTAITYTNESNVVTTASIANDGNPLTGTTVDSIYGSLFINEFGAYTYTADQNAVPAGDPDGQVLDHFVYTLTDGDNDTSQANLDFTVQDVQGPQILNGSLVTNTASGSQEMILTFVDKDHPLDAFAQLFVRDAQGQQGAVASDAGFNINQSDHFQVGLENPIDGHKVLVTDFNLEGITINPSSGNIQLEHEGTSNKPDGFTAVIQPTGGSNPVTGLDSTDGDQNNNPAINDPSAGTFNFLFGAEGNDTLNGGNTDSDLLNGGSGADILNGNGGNDILVYDSADTGLHAVDGGTGFDILRIDDGALYNTGAFQGGFAVPGLTSATVDLAGKSSVITNIEAILLTEEATPDATRGTTLTDGINGLTLADVVGFTGGSINGQTGTANTLFVIGSAGDDVQLDSGWHETATTLTSSGGQLFHQWTQTSGAITATMFIDNNVHVNGVPQ